MKNLILLIGLLFTFNSYSQIQELFEREMAYQHFSGVVLVKQDTEVVAEICHGQTEKGDDFDLHTTFDIGSISKQFTAAAILQLANEGKLQLHDLINTHLGALGSKRWRKVNIHQLLTHTSGIPSLFQTEQGLELFLPEETTISLTDLITRFQDGKLLFSPGEEFSYSNSGYILLAAIIEEASGMSYGQYMQQEVFEKNSLSETSFGRLSGAALPYYGYRDDLLKSAPIYHSSWLIGAGGIYSSANDLAKWVDIITSNDWLTPELRTEYFQGHTRVGNNTYAYGWQITPSGTIEHDGGNAGFISFLSFKPETKEKIIILTNRSFENIHLLGKSTEYVKQWSNKIWQSLQGQKVELLPEITSKSGYTEGSFKSANDLEIQLVKKDTFLFVSSPENYPSRTIANSFLAGDTEEEIRMLHIAELLQKGKYWRLAKYCDGEMSFVAYSGLMGIGFRMISKQVGEITSLHPYLVTTDHGLLRLKGEKGVLDIIVYINDKGEIQGLFEHGFYSSDKAQEIIAYPIGNQTYYLDGFPYGEQDATLVVTEQYLTIEQFGRKITFNKQ